MKTISRFKCSEVANIYRIVQRTLDHLLPIHMYNANIEGECIFFLFDRL